METAAPDGRGIRAGLLSRLELTAVEQVSVFPPGLRPIQIDDTTVDASAMGRPALHAQVQVGGRAIDVITTHLKSKLLTFPGGKFSTRDEGLRAPVRGVRAQPARRRSGHGPGGGYCPAHRRRCGRGW